MKEYLQRGWKLREEIFLKEKNLEFWRSLATSTGSAGSGGSGGSEKSKIELAMVQVIDLETEIMADFEKLKQIEIETLQYIKGLELEEIDKTILQMRYVACKEWWEVRKALNYSDSFIRKRHNNAIKKYR